MIKRCPYCGVILKETTWGRWYCPNHGIIDEEKSEEGDVKSNGKNEKTYIG